MNEEYYEKSVDIRVRRDGELFEKIEELAELLDISVGSVINSLVKTGLEIHMEGNADKKLARLKEKSPTPEW